MVYFLFQYNKQHIIPLEEVKLVSLEDDGSKYLLQRFYQDILSVCAEDTRSKYFSQPCLVVCAVHILCDCQLLSLTQYSIVWR